MTSDLEERLRADLPRLADLITHASLGSPPDVIPTRRRRVPTGPRWIAAAAVATCLALGSIVTIVGLTRNEETKVRTQPLPVRHAAGSWRALPPSPLGPRGRPVIVWTGTEVLAWGGYRGQPSAPLAFQSGAAYDPATNSWREISDNRWAHPGATGVWVGGRMIIAAKNGGAEYDPATDRWRDLPFLPDRVGGVIGVASSGRAVLAVVHGEKPGTIAVATYARTDNRWTIGPPERSSSTGATAAVVSTVWTGHELVVWDGVRAGWAYDPTRRTWHRLPVLTAAGAAPGSSSLAWVGHRLVAVLTYRPPSGAGTGLRAARLVGGRWEVIADAHDVAIDVPIAVDAGGQLIALDRAGRGAPMRADPATGRWSTLDTYPLTSGIDSAAVWTGTGLFVWGGQPSGVAMTFRNPAPHTPDAAWYTP